MGTFESNIGEVIRRTISLRKQGSQLAKNVGTHSEDFKKKKCVGEGA